MIKKYKAELEIMGIPAYYIINDLSYPDEIEHKDESKQYVVVADEYQLPFSETGYRSNIFDKKETETITKENLKQWIIDEAYLQLGLKPGENPWEEAGVNPVTFIKEVKFNKKKDDI